MKKNHLWIWQNADWPNFHWKNEIVEPLLRTIRLKQGILLGRSGAIDSQRDYEIVLDNLLQNIITSSTIEGEQLNAESVRSSLAKKFNFHLKKPYTTSDRSEGLAEIMLDAIKNTDKPLSLKRLSQWHEWLFPEDEFRLQKIAVGKIRKTDPMRVVSGHIDKPIVHFEAPPSKQLKNELSTFIKWFNESLQDTLLDPLLRAAISHFWFVTLHPFDDGNGRITRALTDLALAQAENKSIRLYAMSITILDERKAYYEILEKSQRNSTDITSWITWFLQILEKSLDHASNKIENTLVKARFWQKNRDKELSAEQIKVLNRLLDKGKNGFEQGINTAQYQKVAKVSKATATRHLTDLLLKGCIKKLPGRGRNTRYQIKEP